MKQNLETLIKKLISQQKYDWDEKHIFLMRKHRGFTLDILLEVLNDGYLFELTAPNKVLWGMEIDGKILILALWLFDDFQKPAFKWTKESIEKVTFVHIKTAFWKEETK